MLLGTFKRKQTVSGQHRPFEFILRSLFENMELIIPLRIRIKLNFAQTEALFSIPLRSTIL